MHKDVFIRIISWLPAQRHQRQKKLGRNDSFITAEFDLSSME